MCKRSKLIRFHQLDWASKRHELEAHPVKLLCRVLDQIRVLGALHRPDPYRICVVAYHVQRFLRVFQRCCDVLFCLFIGKAVACGLVKRDGYVAPDVFLKLRHCRRLNFDRAIFQHLVAARVGHDRAVVVNDIVYSATSRLVAVMSQCNVGVRNDKVKAHLFQKLGADSLPDWVDDRNKSGRLDDPVRSLELAYAGRQIRVPDLE